jgi:hypothetical protein
VKMETYPRRPKDDAPNSGVRIDPMPRHMQPEFERLCKQLRNFAQSNYGTWRWAAATYPSDATNANAIYWRSVLKWISQLEYLGTCGHAAGRVRRRFRNRTRRGR